MDTSGVQTHRTILHFNASLLINQSWHTHCIAPLVHFHVFIVGFCSLLVVLFYFIVFFMLIFYIPEAQMWVTGLYWSEGQQ